MKLLHLSDLHLGKRVNEISMLPDQKHILSQILHLVEEEAPDAVHIAGDVYDKTVPPAEAVTLFDDFLVSLVRLHIPTFVISGNHDSPERLAFAGRLLAETGIHISPVYDGQLTPVTLQDEHGSVDFFLLPFLKPAHVRHYYPDETIETYSDACRVALSAAPSGSNRRVLLAHQFVTGSATCESEEITVGGSDNVDAAVFDGFDYVALGHLHGPQNADGSRIRYCGTPLKYSFSEEQHHKSVTIVNLGAKGELQLSLRPLTPLHELRTLRGSFSEVSAADPSEDYLHIVLTDEDDIPDAAGRLRLHFPNLMKLSYDNTRTRENRQIDGAEDLQRRSPMELFDALFQLQNNRPMSEQQHSYIRSLFETLQEGRL